MDAVGGSEGVVRGLDGEFADAPEQAMRLGQGALRDLHEADGILGVTRCLAQPSHLVPQPLGHGQARGVITRARDSQARGEAPRCPADRPVIRLKGASGGGRRRVEVDAQGHGSDPLPVLRACLAGNHVGE